MTSSDRESALVLGLLLLGAGAYVVWVSVQLLKNPRFEDPLSKRLGGDRYAKWLRAIRAAYPGLVRVNAAIVGLVGVVFCAAAGWMLLSALLR